MYAFVHLCMYAYVHVCMYACMHRCMYVIVIQIETECNTFLFTNSDEEYPGAPIKNIANKAYSNAHGHDRKDTVYSKANIV